MSYRKSSFSQLECVEVAPLEDRSVALRSTKDRGLSPHVFDSEEWRQFIGETRAGWYDFADKPAV